MISRTLATLAITWLTFSTAHSQEPTIETEILALALDQPVADLFFSSSGAPQPFQANLTGLSEPLPYKGPVRFDLRSNKEEFLAKPPLPAPTASVSLPQGADRILLLCVKSQDKPLRLVAYDISKGRSGVGDYRFFNFSQSTISAIFGEKKFAIQPGADTLLSDPAWKEDVLEIDMELAIIKDGKAKPAYTSVWGHRPGRRSFVFFFTGSQTYKPIRICRFFDVPSSAASPPP